MLFQPILLKPADLYQVFFQYNLESQPDLKHLQNPEMMLGSSQDLLIWDEIQEMPEIFIVLRVRGDQGLLRILNCQRDIWVG